MATNQFTEKLSLKNIITTIMLVLSFITGVLTFDNRYASSEDLKKTETQLVQTLEKFKSDQILDRKRFEINQIRDRLEQRFINLTDQSMQFKILIKKNPNDIELKEDYQKVESERQEVKNKLESAKNDRE